MGQRIRLVPISRYAARAGSTRFQPNQNARPQITEVLTVRGTAFLRRSTSPSRCTSWRDSFSKSPRNRRNSREMFRVPTSTATSQARTLRAARSAAHQPARFSGQPARRIHTGSSTAGKSLAIAPRAIGTLASAGHFLHQRQPAHNSKYRQHIVVAAACEFHDHQRIPGIDRHAEQAVFLAREKSRPAAASPDTSAAAKGALKAIVPGNSFQAQRYTSSVAGG